MLVYSTIASLDGYTADAEGKFDWAEPDAEVHAYINDLERESAPTCTDETMLFWETAP